MRTAYLRPLAFVFVCLATAIALAERPNVVVVFIDDMGWGDLSCFGGESVKTENVDRLAGEGIRFTHFYVNAPICSPSRCAITTGQYPQRWRITSYLAHRGANHKRGMAQWLDPAAPTLARLLHRAGYATGHFGKWHLGGQRDVGEAPLITEYGFDASLTNFEGLGPRVLPLCDAFDGRPPRKHALGSDNLGRGQTTWRDRSLVTESFVARTLAFVKRAEADGKPFYVNVWPDDVHSPFYPPKARRGDAAKRTLYHGVLDTMDEQLGALFDYIRTRETLRDNTLVLIASDNGPESGAGSAGPFRGVKGMLYEGGIRSPLIVWGPGIVDEAKRGTKNDTTVLAAMDLVPSLLAIAGTDKPAGVEFDGLELADVLVGKSNEPRDRPVYWRRPPDRPGDKNERWPDLAMREGNWKFLMQYDGSAAQLYDLSADPGETKNLADDNPELTARCTRQINAWNAQLPTDAGQTPGEVIAPVSLPFSSKLAGTDGLRGWSYFGHHQFIEPSERGVHLGVVPEHPVNDYRCGEKLMLDGGDWDDFTAAVTVRVFDGTHGSGLLFRTTGPSVGYDAHRGYFAGIIPKVNRVVLGRMDGVDWTELARADVKMDFDRDYRLSVTARGESITVTLDGKTVIAAQDRSYQSGTIGLRVVRAHAVFREIEVE